MLSVASANTETMFSLAINIGGTGAGNPRVTLDMPSSTISIPTVDAQQVISTTINFTAEGSIPGATSTVFDLTETNDIAVRYYA